MFRSFSQTRLFDEAIKAGAYELSPITRKVELKLPSFPFQLRWLTPAAVIVRHPHGEGETVPDPTKVLLAAITAAGFVVAMISRMMSPRQALRELGTN